MLELRRLDKRDGSVDTSERAGASASDTTSSSARLILLERLETLDTVDGVRDKDEDAVDVIERGVGPLEGEETDWVIKAGSGGGGGGGGGRGVDATEVVIVSVTAVKLPKLVSGETLGRINDESKEASCPS
jgi:hypothetical protein